MKINIGGEKGKNQINTKGWSIVDVRKGADYLVDLNKQKLPFKNGAVSSIYTSHTLEHLLPERMRFIFSEMYRVLPNGGTIRTVVPDIDIAIKAYYEGKKDFLRNPANPEKLKCLPDIPICYLNSWFFTYKTSASNNKNIDFSHFNSNYNPSMPLGGHVISFNFELMSYYLSSVGFKNIRRMTFNKCSKEFVGCDLKRHANTSLYVEAVK